MQALAETFDYSQLERSEQEALRQHAQRLGALSQSATTSLWKMGQILADAQTRLATYGNGTFIHWTENEAGLNRKAAYRLIYIYRAFDLDKLSKTTLAKSALHVLSEPSTPPEARSEALRRAGRGETITHAKAQEIVSQYRPPSPPRPPLPPLPARPPLPPSPEYTAFEREKLMPCLHDAGDPDAPQVLSGLREVLHQALPEQKARARASLREGIVEAIRGADTSDEEALGRCVDEILRIFAQNNSSIAISARFGVALAQGPKTLTDLTELCIWACGESMDGMERPEYLRWRKRTLRTLDSITWCGGLTLFEHELESGQLCYALNEEGRSNG